MVKNCLFFVFIMLPTAWAGIRVHQVTLHQETFYVVSIYSRPEPLPIVGYVRLGDGLVLGPELESGEPFDPNFEAIDYLVREGESLLQSPDLIPIDPKLREAIARARVPHELAQPAEQYIRQIIEAKMIGIYKDRKAKVEGSYFDSLAVREGLFKDGNGVVAIFDSQKRILGTLTYLIRTETNPLLATERADEVRFGDLERKIETEYPILTKSGIKYLKGQFFPVLTMELKRFGVIRKSTIDLLPVLIYFGEINGMSRYGAPSRSEPLYHGRPALMPDGLRLVVGRYVIAGDEAAADVYASEPYNFTRRPDIKGKNGNFYLTSDRQNFLGLWERSNRPSKRRMDGRIFVTESEIRGGLVGPPQENEKGILSGQYKKRSWWILKKDLLDIPSRPKACFGATTSQSPK